MLRFTCRPRNNAAQEIAAVFVLLFGNTTDDLAKCRATWKTCALWLFLRHLREVKLPSAKQRESAEHSDHSYENYDKRRAAHHNYFNDFPLLPTSDRAKKGARPYICLYEAIGWGGKRWAISSRCPRAPNLRQKILNRRANTLSATQQLHRRKQKKRK